MIATPIAPRLAVTPNITKERKGREDRKGKDRVALRVSRPFGSKANHSPRIAASGTRFGRIRIAIATAIPAARAINKERKGRKERKERLPLRPSRPLRSSSSLSGVSVSAHATAIAHAAAAGTSLIGAISMNSIAGLVATSHAAPSPTHGRPMRRPIQDVANVSAPPASGTIQKIVQRPAIALALAL